MTSKSQAATSGFDGSSEASTTPVTMTPSMAAAPSASGSPRATAIIAPMAPSVATIGATIETLPIRSAEYANWSPMT